MLSGDNSTLKRAAQAKEDSIIKLENEIQFGYYIVFVWKSKADYDNVTYDAIENDLVKVFKKAGLL